MSFNVFKTAVQRQFNEMKKHDLFRVELDKDKLWDLYLASYPEGTNLIYKERTEYDCNCCKQFIRAVGNMVSIIDGKIVTIWDGKTEGEFQIVTDALAKYVKACPIENVFLHDGRVAGTDKSYQNDAGNVITWEHFHIQLPNELVARGIDIGPKLSIYRSTKDIMIRGLRDLTVESINIVLELIEQNSLYRGEEHKFAVSEFLKIKNQFDKCKNVAEQEVFCWSQIKKAPASVSRFRNTVIGTLIMDLSDGVDLDRAVASFESKVAPTNYKRPTSIATKSMIDAAKKKIEELGFMSSTERRFARIEDITINNVLYADRSVKKVIDNVFDDMVSKISVKTKNIDKVEEVSIEKFLADILPKAESLEVMMENKHYNNLMSLIAPCDLTAKSMFKWDNNFSWSYNGDVADSMKERVKAAGGRVDGVLRFSIQWSGDGKDNSDLDAHCLEPTGHIYFSSKRAPSGGNLDVDITQPISQCKGSPAVENITWPDRREMADGAYKFYVKQFSARSSKGFTAEIEFDGNIFHYEYPRAVSSNVQVAEVTLKNGVFTIAHKLGSSASVKEVWGVRTQSFHKVNALMFSPNYWDEKAVGNKHFFFLLEGCKNEGTARGFYNEFLTAELDQHRKVLEMVGAKMHTEESDHQLSGLGFSSTNRNDILCRVKGAFSRTIKIVF